MALDYVADGHGMPDPDSGAVESPDAEVDRVVDLVLDHAAKRPHESLMVITASEKHACHRSIWNVASSRKWRASAAKSARSARRITWVAE